MKLKVFAQAFYKKISVISIRSLSLADTVWLVELTEK